MTYEYGLYIGVGATIVGMACLHGILLSLILSCNKRLRSRANNWLALAITGLSFVLGFDVLYWLDVIGDIPNFIHYLPLYLPTLLPIGLYWFVQFTIQPNKKIARSELWIFLPLGLEVIAGLGYLIIDVSFVGSTNNWYAAVLEKSIELIGVISGMVIITLTWRKINGYQQYLFNNYSTTYNRSLGWLRKYLIFIVLLSMCWLFGLIFDVLTYWDLADYFYSFESLIMTILLFWVGYIVIIRSQDFERIDIAVEKEKYEQNSKLSSKTDDYYKQLLELMNQNEIYVDVDLTLQSLAKRLDISAGYLSRIISENEEKNFFEFVNTYRVELVKRRLLDSKFDHYTILGIAYESGFNSKTTFNTVFKKFTGLTPSAFKKNHRS